VARPLPLLYTVVLAVLAAAAAGYGLLVADAYRLVSEMTRATWLAQDAVTLVSLPLLIVAARRAQAGSLAAHVGWVGGLTWLTYCYAHLSVGAPFNVLFLVYVAVMGLAGFAMLDGLLRVDADAVSAAFARAPNRIAAGFLGSAGVGIAGLWLSDIVAALPDGRPVNLHLAELPNPTWVLDLVWLIPVSVAAAVMLWRRHPAAALVAGAMLVALFILSSAMLVLVPFAVAAGLHSEPAIAGQLVVFSVVFTVLGVIEAALLTVAHRRMVGARQSWRRAGWWA
jgi:hypothetical protein